MKSLFRYGAAIGSLIVSSAALAGGISVSHAWIRMLPGDLPAGAYAQVSNGSQKPRVLVGASAPGFDRAMLHQSVTKNGQDQMIHVKRIPIDAGQTFEFAPGGYHIMLMPPHDPFSPGDTVPVTLEFADGSTITAPFVVKGANALDDR